MRDSSDKVRKPWAMVPPNGVCAAAAGSVWMNWRSSVASANASMRAWSTVSQPDTPVSLPMRLRISAMLAVGISGVGHDQGAVGRGGERDLHRVGESDAFGGKAFDQREHDRGAVAGEAVGIDALVLIDQLIVEARGAEC